MASSSETSLTGQIDLIANEKEHSLIMLIFLVELDPLLQVLESPAIYLTQLILERSKTSRAARASLR
jgi:hypothetical protein